MFLPTPLKKIIWNDNLFRDVFFSIIFFRCILEILSKIAEKPGKISKKNLQNFFKILCENILNYLWALLRELSQIGAKIISAIRILQVVY